MRLVQICLIVLLSCAPLGSAWGEQLDRERSSTIDLLIDRAISRNLISGAVVVVGSHTGILYSTAKGETGRPGSPKLSDHTMFDLASLTKVIATTPAIMKLLDEGKLSLVDPLPRWFPEFAGTPLENATVLNLLTHTSGLNDFDISSDNAMSSAIHKAASEKVRCRPGTSFNYADINFILLGELVHRASGKTLDAFCRDEIYGPIGAGATMFLPPKELADTIAPTLGFSGGVVQDANARRLGGVAGHAGLFSTAYDLSRFARLILGNGIIDGTRILSERVVTQMTAPYFYSNGRVIRGLGWDMESPFSAPKGSLFSDVSFGHTGYSGTSIWIDPKQDIFVIVLTNRLNYRDTHTFNQLRRDISTIAAADFTVADDLIRLIAPVEVARISAELLRPALAPATLKTPIRKTKVKLLAYASETRSHHPSVKKRGKGHRHKSYGKIRRA
ncbi:serine hydrolase domain-containing protein [Geotalea sp. SG265]|uniref:serine hydrolase domain-containing protein n=1 Tax=Geotalea sp. SG265 TaxID=2922867 RepID=UPI001FAF05FB|nr:serine hydrolase domain-containing protein [Geotalea sp. SG265]